MMQKGPCVWIGPEKDLKGFYIKLVNTGSPLTKRRGGGEMHKKAHFHFIVYMLS